MGGEYDFGECNIRNSIFLIAQQFMYNSRKIKEKLLIVKTTTIKK
jgi:hypothetical protein